MTQWISFLKKKKTKNKLQFCISGVLLKHDLSAFKEGESPCQEKLITDHRDSRKKEYYNKMKIGYKNINFIN